MIQVEHLTKRYGSHAAVSDLSFSIQPGQIYGLLGPNGAGKSTTMNICTGCLAPTAGEVTVGGYDIFQDPLQARRLIGYLPEQPPVYPEMTPMEYLRFVGRAKGLKKAELDREVERAMARTDIAPMAHRLIRNLSKGYRQRLGIAQTLLADPPVVILDEPTVGLDPKQIIEIRDLIRDLGRDHTVILSSHILSEVQAVCGQILIISRGKLVASGRPEELERARVGHQTVQFTLRCEPERARQLLGRLCGPEAAQLDPDPETGTVDVALPTGPEGPGAEEVFFACAAEGVPLLRLDTQRATLEDVFLELTAGEEPVQPPDAPEEEEEEVAP